VINDPLNWPAWRKTIAFISIGIFTALGGWVLGCVSPGVVLLMDDFHKDLKTTVDGAINWGAFVLGVGVGPDVVSLLINRTFSGSQSPCTSERAQLSFWHLL
jgi:hypothetical protein